MINPLRALFARRATITAAEAHQAAKSGALLVDVREPDEWRAGHVAKSRHIPLSHLGDHLNELPSDRPIITVCRTGRRSGIAAKTLNGKNFQAANLTGGLHAWAAAGLPVVAEGGAPGRVI